MQFQASPVVVQAERRRGVACRRSAGTGHLLPLAVAALASLGGSAPALALGGLDAAVQLVPALQLDDGLVADVVASTGVPALAPLLELPAADAPASRGSPSGAGAPRVSGGGKLGIGLQVGSPTALTFKFNMSPVNDLVLGVGLGYNYGKFGFGLSLHGDYLFSLAKLVDNSTLSLVAYAGPGLWVLINSGYGFPIGSPYVYGFDLLAIGVRVPLGLNLTFAAAPIEIYLELDPALFVFPGPGFYPGASLGFRWFF